jgi:hypothetical protein
MTAHGDAFGFCNRELNPERSGKATYEGSGYKDIIKKIQFYPVWPKNDANP